MKKYTIVLLTLFSALSLFAQIDAVSCKGRISPDGKVYRIAAVNPSGSQAVIKSLFIKKGEFVKANQPLAELVGIDKAKLALNTAQANFDRTQALANLNILRQKQNLLDLEGTFAQNKKVLEDKDPPRREKEQLEFEQDTLQRHIAYAKEMLNAVQNNESSNIKSAKASLDEAKAFFTEYTITAPVSGNIVEIHSKSGELAANEGFCEIADTTNMFVEAEVYESDVKKIKIGDLVECISDATNGKTLKGKVVEISQYVKSNNLFSTDPNDFTNSRVVLVKILLDNPDLVKNLIGSQVSVRIILKK